jgi:hypothetical protein
MCARFLPAYVADDGANASFGFGYIETSTEAYIGVPVQVRPRIRPTGLAASTASNFTVRQPGSSLIASAVVLDKGSSTMCSVKFTVSGATAGQSAQGFSAATGAYLIFTGAEL